MTKRESGWYKIKFNSSGEPEIAFHTNGKWLIVGSDVGLGEHDIEVICKVMTLDGQIVYNQPTERAKAAVERYNNPNSWNVNEHDPLCNTKQEW